MPTKTNYDPDADQQHDLDHLRSAEKNPEQANYDREFGDIVGRYDDHAEHPLGDQETGGRAAQTDRPADTPPSDRKDTSRRGGINDRLNKGYTGNKDKKTAVSKMFKGNSKLKQRIAIAGAAAGGSVIAGIMIFLVLLPLKIGYIIKNIEGHFEAGVTSSMEKEVDNVFSQYVARSILPSILAGECKSTISPSCKVTPSGVGMFGSVFKAWSDGNIEYDLATENDWIFAKDGPNIYMSVKGDRTPIDAATFQKLRTGELSVFDMPGLKRVSRNEARLALRSTTQWYNVYKRFKVNELADRKWGIVHCLLFCKTRDDLADSFTNKKVTAKLLLSQRLLPQKYGLILSCVIAGAQGTCDPTKLDTAQAGDTERLTPFQKQLQQQLIDYGAKFNEATLKQLTDLSTDISDNGFKKVAAREAIKAIIGAVGGDAVAGEAAGVAAEKAIPIVGWAILGANIMNAEATMGPLVQHAAYSMAVASAVETYETFSTIVAECQSGHCDSEAFGSFNQALATSMSGNPAHAVDFTHSPLWQSIIEGNTVTSTDVPCDDGSFKLKCPEENFADDGNSLLNFVSNMTKYNPIMRIVSKWITILGNKPTEWIGSAASILPGYSDFSSWVGDAASTPLSWLMNQVITTPDIDNGARLVDTIMAGSDALTNASCQVQLGCAHISDQAVANIRSQQVTEEKESFESLPLFARMFSTDTPYSLVSQLAMDMPTSLLGATNAALASVLTSPLHSFRTMFSDILSGKTAFAASAVQADPFGIPQNAYLASQIPADPVTYWDNNCVAGPMALYDETTQILDVSNWLNQQQMDKNSGEAEANTPNPCLLIQAAAQSSGGLFGSNLLPTSSATPDQL